MCEVTRAQLIAWVDGELEGATLDAHVSGCAECRNEMRAMQAVSAQVVEYCKGMAGERRGGTWWWIPAAVAAMVLLAAGLVWMRRPTAVSAPAVGVSVSPPAIAPEAPLVQTATAVRTPVHRRTARRFAARPRVELGGGPGLLVVIPIDELLPAGAAPPGAVLVGNLTFDAGGQPARLSLQ